jgi:adenylyl cyclase-associated protein
LTSYLLRLEAAASRFEDIASSIVPQGSSSQPDAITGASAAAAPKSGSQPSINLPKTDILPPEIEDYDTLINGDLATFVKLSQVLDPLLAEQVGVPFDITGELG